MDANTGASAAFALAFFFFCGAAGLTFLGVIVYFLVTLHRIADSLEAVGTALSEDRLQEKTSSEAQAVASGEANGASSGGFTQAASQPAASEGSSTTESMAHPPSGGTSSA